MAHFKSQWKLQFDMLYIRAMDELRRIDLNLLLALNALLEEMHVTRAARRLNRSQPAVSQALAQLRAYFDDPLLIRHGGRFELTVRARQLQRPLSEALVQLSGLLSKTPFNPSEVRREFRIAMSDYASHIVLPPLMRHLRIQAPGIQLAIVQGRSREAMVGQLLDGDIDIALGVFDSAPAEVQVQPLFEDTFVCVVDAKVMAGAEMGLEDWLARPHVMLALRPDAVDEIDGVLKAMNRERFIALALPHWSAALEVIRDTDLILTVAARAARDLAAYPTLKSFAVPLPLPPLTYQQAWHKRRVPDPGHEWLRRTIAMCSRC
jgi:DNA-binding transcriptional LysR family regulator